MKKENTQIKLSNCCDAPIVEDSDYCSKCHEHCDKSIGCNKEICSAGNFQVCCGQEGKDGPILCDKCKGPTKEDVVGHRKEELGLI